MVTAILCTMRKILPAVLLALCFASEAVGQATWSLPKLKELDQSNAIGKTTAIQLSTEETSLLRQLTHRITTACVADPGPGDPKIAEEIFKSLRIDWVELTSRGDSALVVQGDGVCMCGAVGNCPLWLLSGGQNPRLLLKALGIQSFAIQNAGANTHFDLILGSHDSAMETDLQRFRFDGVRYKRIDAPIFNGTMRVGTSLVRLALLGVHAAKPISLDYQHGAGSSRAVYLRHCGNCTSDWFGSW